MSTNTTLSDITNDIFKVKQKNSQTSYLCFSLSGIHYAINIQNITNIIENHSLVYLSHMSPPIVAMQHYNNSYIPILDFAGYRPCTKGCKLLILTTNYLRKDHPFGLVVDNVSSVLYFKQNELKLNTTPFNELLPAYYYAFNKKLKIHLLDVQDLANQID